MAQVSRHLTHIPVKCRGTDKYSDYSDNYIDYCDNYNVYCDNYDCHYRDYDYYVRYHDNYSENRYKKPRGQRLRSCQCFACSNQYAAVCLRHGSTTSPASINFSKWLPHLPPHGRVLPSCWQPPHVRTMTCNIPNS